MPNGLDVFMELCLHSVLAKIIQQCRELDNFSFAILDGTSARSFEIEDEEVFQMSSCGFGRYFES
jgi:hypothetical protein